MKTGWKSLIVVGAVLALVSSQVMAQPWGGPGRGPRHSPGPGAGFVPHAPGPMGMGMGGPAGGWGSQTRYNAFGNPCPFCCPLGPAPGGLLGLAWWLDLTEEQTTKLGTIYEKAQADANAVTDAVVSARDALHKAVISGTTEEQIRAAAAKLGTAIGNQAASGAKTLAAAKAVLTEEQRKDLEKIQGKLPPPHRGDPMAGNGLGRGWGGGPRGPNPGAGGPARRQIPHQQ